MIRRLVLILAAFLFVSISLAQTPRASDDADVEAARDSLSNRDLSQEEIRELLARLSDSEVRELLIQRLDAAATGASPRQAGLTDSIDSAMSRLEGNLAADFSAIGRLHSVPGVIVDGATAGGRYGILFLMVALAASLAAGIAADAGLNRMVAGVTDRRRVAQSVGFAGKFGMLLMRAITDLLRIAAFAVASLAVCVFVTGGTGGPTILVGYVVAGICTVRAASILLCMLLSPDAPALRAAPVSDDGARAIHRAVVVSLAIAVTYGLLSLMLASYGADAPLSRAVRWVGSAVLVLALCGFIVNGRHRAAAFIREHTRSTGSASSAISESIARNWHIIVIGYLLVLYVAGFVVSTITGRPTLMPALASLGLIVMIPILDVGLQALAARVSGHGQSAESEHDAAATTADSGFESDSTTAPGDRSVYEIVILRNLRLLLGIVIVLSIARMWGVSVRGVAESLVGLRVAEALFNIALISLLAWAVWQVVRAAVAHRISPKTLDEESHGDDVGGLGKSRVETLLPLVRKFVLVTLIVMVTLVALSSLGVNIGPLLAGAGIVGIAIGFGAQTLVRDVVSGFFFLLDDAFRMGEYVEMDNIRGTVQKISSRSLQLRHHNGPVHTVPFGEIRHLTNYSRDWVMMKFEIRLPFETDIDTVRRIIKKIGQAMSEDPELGPLMLEPMKSQGVHHMDDSAMVIRLKFKSIPGQQFYIRREAYTRIQKAFEEKGIKFAPRRVIVEAAPGITPTDAAAAAAAAEQARPTKG